MEEKVLHTRLVQKHDIESRWKTATNFVPKQGEAIIYDDRYTDENGKVVVVSPRSRLKIGDGSTGVNNLPFIDSYLENQVHAATDLLLSSISSKLGGTDGLTYTDLGGGTAYSVSSSSSQPLVAIASEYNNAPVTTIAAEGFSGNSTMERVYIPSTITSIGAQAFKGCTNLKSDGISESITSIGDYAFENCTSLSSFTINYNTSIGKNPIKGCSNITSISMRYGESAPTLGVSGNAIYNNENTFDTLLCGCSGTTGIDYNTNTIAEDAFYGLSKVNLSLSSMSLRSIGARAFFQCTGMTAVDGGDSLHEIGAQAFYGCTGLKSISIPAAGIAATIDPTAFRGCANVESVFVGRYSEEYANDYSEGNCILNKSRTVIFGCMNSVIPTDSPGIGEYAFWNCEKLGEIVIPSSVTTVGANAFLDCKNALILCEAESKPSGWASNWVPSGISVFWGYTGKGENQGLKWINTTSGAAIYQYSGTGATVNIPEIISGTVKSINGGVFSGSSSLESITLPFVGGSVATSASKSTLFGYIFGTSNYEGSTEIKQHYRSGRVTYTITYYIPASLKSVTITGGNILTYALENCSTLTNITIGSGITSIGSDAFKNCTSVQTYDFSSCTSIPTLSSTSAFSGINANCKIRVPASLYSDWITATNWSTYASYIEAVEV